MQKQTVVFNILQVALSFPESEAVRDPVILALSGPVCVVQGHDVWNQ